MMAVPSDYLECKDDSCPILHSAAMHPDLHVAKLTLHFGSGLYPQLLTTLNEDTKALTCGYRVIQGNIVYYSFKFTMPWNDT